jgi:hypothetical protein
LAKNSESDNTSSKNNTSSKKIKDKRDKGLFDHPLFNAVKEFPVEEEVEQKPNTEESQIKEVKKEENNQEFPIINRLEFHGVFKYFKEKKDKIIKIIAAFIGFLLIIVGVILLNSSMSRVIDNVVFGERAMFSVFLILIGIMILVAIFARKYLNNTFLNKIQTELEVEEGKSKEVEEGKSRKSKEKKSKSKDEASTEKDRSIDEKD